MTGKGTPRVSFVIIAYNEQENIRRCVQSILGQSSPCPFEIIVVDDGSVDRTAEVLAEVASGVPNLRAVSLGRNQGRGQARQAGISAARGELIAMVDADIVIPPHWLTRVLAALDTGYDAVGGIAVPDGDCAYLGSRFGLSPRVRAHSVTVSGGNGLYRREVFDVTPVDASLRNGEDIALVKAMEAKGFRLMCLSDLVVEHRENKSFVASLRWLFESGTGASRQYRRYRQLRAPDVAFAAEGALALLGSAMTLRTRRALPVLVVPTLGLLGLGAVHAATRFDLARTGFRTGLAAVAANSVLMTAYIIGRAVGHTKAMGAPQ
jgi:glycosyltransferase involved in cell wall biosynthesis